MYKNKTKDQIIQILKESPKTQKEISNLLEIKFNKKLSRQVLNRHLIRLIKHYIIAELYRNHDTKSFIKFYRGFRLKDKSQRIYFYIPLSRKFHRRLIKKCSQNGKNDRLISEISALYRFFEVYSIYLKILTIDKRIVKIKEKSYKRDYSEETINKIIRETKKEISDGYKRKKPVDVKLLEKFTAPLKMDKYMSWVFNYNHKNMIKSSDEMIYKMLDLFTKVYLEKYKNSIRYNIICRDT